MDKTRPAQDPRFAFLDSMTELPSLPQVLVGITRVASDPKSSASDLADLILRDQALTLKLLRIANSGRYALYSQRVTTVSRAVMLLGFQSVRAIALGLGSFHLLSALQKGGRILEGFWREAISTAVICQELGELYRMGVAEEAFVAGLLHDVGKLILSERDPAAAEALYGQSQGGPDLLRAETETFGVDHTEVAGELARRWDLPDVLRKAMTLHHRHFPAPPSDRGELLAFLIGASKTLSRPLGEMIEDPRDLAAKMARVLRRPVGSLLAVLQELPDKIQTYADFFEIDVEDLKAYACWVENENQRLVEAFSQQEEERRRLESRRAEMTAIREVNALLVQGSGADVAVLRALRAAREAAGARRSVVAVLGEARQELRPAWSDGDITPQFLESFRFPLSEGGVLDNALTGGRAIAVFDTGLPYFKRLMSGREMDIFDCPCFAVLPLIKGTKKLGVLYADRSDGDEPFGDEEVETLTALADLVTLAMGG